MSCLVPPACVFCHHYHLERNEHTDELPSCNAFSAIPDEIFMGLVDHTEAFPGDNGVRFGLREAEREAFLDLNAVRQELGLLVYREPKRNTCRPVGGDNRETSERTEEDMGMTRRTFIQATVSGAVISTGFAAGLFTPRGVRAALPPQTFFAASPTEAIRAVLGTDQSALDEAVELNVTETVEMADMVPLSVRARLDKVESITIVGDKNPNRIIAHYRLGPRLQPYLATRVRLARSSDVTALVKANGTLHQATRHLQASTGGCGDPEPGPDASPARATIPDHFLMKTAKDDEGLVVRVLIHHPMLPPHKDPMTGAPVSGLYIQQVTAQLNGKTVLIGDWSSGVSRDPYLSFKIRQAARGDVIRVNWADNAGHLGASQVTLG